MSGINAENQDKRIDNIPIYEELPFLQDPKCRPHNFIKPVLTALVFKGYDDETIERKIKEAEEYIFEKESKLDSRSIC